MPLHPQTFQRLATLALMMAGSPALPAKQWIFKGVPEPLEAEFVAEKNGYVVLTGANEKSFELPLASFSKSDQEYIRLVSADPAERKPVPPPGKPVLRNRDYKIKSSETLDGRMVAPEPASEIHLTGTDDPLTGSFVNFTVPDGWLFFDHLPPSVVEERFLDRFLVNGAPADLESNLRLVQYGPGCVVIPHGPDFPALTVFDGASLGGKPMAMKTYVNYGEKELDDMNGPIRSFVLRRGYMATLAENVDGTGASRNYVAQDHDIVVNAMPKGLDSGVQFVRVFPWRWTGKKGIAGGIHEPIKAEWFYDWNIGARSTPDLEYVAIKQKRDWPGLNQDWKAKGINHLLGFNEPDRPDQANMSVDEAIKRWPELMGTGLRLGSPATSDGGLGWLFEFIDKADRAGLRVDFVAVHYYRGIGNPGDEEAAASQFLGFLQGIYDRVKRPIWITEWNNGANWTSTPDPNDRDQKAAIEAMIRMLDETPWVERYAPYNWVEPCRELVRKDNSLSPAGEIYRDHDSPVFYVQPKAGK